MGTNVQLALSILTTLIEQVASVGSLIKNAQDQNRDVTDDELNTLVTGYKTAHTQLDADIAAKGG